VRYAVSGGKWPVTPYAHSERSASRDAPRRKPASQRVVATSSSTLISLASIMFMDTPPPVSYGLTLSASHLSQKWWKSSQNFSVEFVALRTYSLGIQDLNSRHTEFSLVMGQRPEDG